MCSSYCNNLIIVGGHYPGLLCRHDNVLWLANMTTAGERQFFAIALLLKLFRHLPDDMHVGVLYDVACQLHRSCVKWGFLDKYIHRMLWSVSVFHAYGHQWPCQLVYHPRKCVGFGLSDGEGCERFWDAIKLLIPALRVSGVSSRFIVNLYA
jgi:Kyakuja-Dileera-Zisupton transposase